MPTSFYDLSQSEREARLHAFALSALSLWPGSFDKVALVKYRENAVFSARRGDGSRIALRIHRSGYHSEAAVRSELLWMQAIRSSGIEVPEVVPTRSGAVLAIFENPALPEARQVDMLDWLDGTPVSVLAEDAADPGIFITLGYDAGVLAARLHKQAAGWSLPPTFERLRWDSDGLIGDDPLWGRFWELPALTRDQRALIEAVRTRARADLLAFGEIDSNFGLIHADLIPDNLLSHEGQLRPIDFDDSGFGWYMFDIATILFAYIDEPFYQEVEDALFEGYQSVRVLTERDRAHLPLFMLLRSLTYLGWIQTRADAEIAQSLAPLLIERACRLATGYLQNGVATDRSVQGG